MPMETQIHSSKSALALSRQTKNKPPTAPHAKDSPEMSAGSLTESFARPGIDRPIATVMVLREHTKIWISGQSNTPLQATGYLTLAGIKFVCSSHLVAPLLYMSKLLTLY